MKRALLICAAGAAALTLAGCNRKEAATNEANPGQSAPVNAAQDAAGAAVGQVSASTLGANSTEAFVSNAAQSDMYEIKAGQMAQQKGQAAGVKDFGKMMVTDHTAMTNQMKPLIQAAGKTPPADLDQRRKGMLDNLTAANGADFDKVYLAQQEAAHNEALTLMQGYADHGDDAGLKAAAAKAVPKVQMHLDKVKQLQAAASNSAAPPANK
jgi:putative membrane protein